MQERSRIGDWESDLVTGQRNQSAIITLVDRTSRCLRLSHLSAGHGAEADHALITLFGTCPSTPAAP